MNNITSTGAVDNVQADYNNSVTRENKPSKQHLVSVEREVNNILIELKKTRSSHTQEKDIESLEATLENLNKNFILLKKTVSEPKSSIESKAVKKVDSSMRKIIQTVAKGKLTREEGSFLLQGVKSMIKDLNNHIGMVKKSTVNSTDKFKF
ncbi:hypothetical protein [Photobacterium kishitanii]|uniref:Uncharacterized protein n=1 Tax=Photobacterium kishitanii TaxID=318456 RepID=A0A2T3KMX6_9GAMM|nr:hypothetical protein [Photobacterium kishitanii]PSV01149.1 hypothetical protein C9J27_03760 [Photobacterium kishitanii]